MATNVEGVRGVRADHDQPRDAARRARAGADRRRGLNLRVGPFRHTSNGPARPLGFSQAPPP